MLMLWQTFMLIPPQCCFNHTFDPRHSIFTHHSLIMEGIECVRATRVSVGMKSPIYVINTTSKLIEPH